MRRPIIYLFCSMVFLTNIILAQDAFTLEDEYMGLLENIRLFGPQATIPQYVDADYFHRYSGRHMVDVDNEFVFSIIGSGFMRFIDPEGNIRYSRNLWLSRSTEGYLYGAAGRYADELFEQVGDRIFLITAYLPKPGTNIIAGSLTMELDDAISVERYIMSHSLNTSLVDLVYTVNRMIEILYILKHTEPEPWRNYDFKIRTLEIILDYAIEDRFEVDKEIRERAASNHLVTQRDFIEMHIRLPLIRDMLLFVEIDR